jgi:hypothetical protein
MAILFAVAWFMALGRLIGTKFWDDKYNLERIHEKPTDALFYNSTAFGEVNLSYYTYRHVFFSPHVIAAILWWNLYFLQLFPSIRKRFLAFHRYLGRVLMVVALAQVASGLGLACTSKSSTIKLVSFALAIAIANCVYHAWRYAMARDIRMHKYWAMRLVGYMQTIALQRLYMMLLIISHQCGFYFFYPSLDGASEDEVNTVILQIFDDSFVICILTAILVTEWYLSAEQGMMNDPVPTVKVKARPPPANTEECRPLISSTDRTSS